MLDFSDLDAQMIGDFLVHLEEERGASVTTRNARLAAVHSLFGFAAFRHPSTPSSLPASCRSRRNAALERSSAS